MATSTWVIDSTTETFEAEVLTTSHQTPVLVDFWAAWCGPCRALGPILERLAEEYAGGFVLAKVDADKEQQLAAAFKVTSLPTVALFKGGKAVASFVGAQPEGKIRALLTQHGVEAGGEKPAWSDVPDERVAQLRAAVAEHPTRGALQLELAQALIVVNADDEAGRLLEALPADVYGDARAARARAQLALRARAQATDTPVPVLNGVRALLAGDIASGVSQLLDALRDDKSEESPARLALVDAFRFIEDETVVRDARRRMASLLF
jgi:putative thioredoxin